MPDYLSKKFFMFDEKLVSMKLQNKSQHDVDQYFKELGIKAFSDAWDSVVVDTVEKEREFTIINNDGDESIYYKDEGFNWYFA